jgi:hypothetical protein
MSAQDLAASFGIGGLVIVIGYRLAIVFIRAWRETERERTMAIADGFRDLTQSQQNIATDVAEIKGLLGAGEPRRATPAHGLRVLRVPTNHDKDK